MKARPFLIWGSVIVGAFASPLIASKAINAVAENEWQAAQAQAKKAGVPLDVKTALADYQAGPDQDNAAEGVKAVLRKTLKPPRPDSYTEFQGGLRDKLKDALKAIEEENRKGAAANLARVERAVAAFEPHISELQVALDKPNWNFKREWEMGAAMLLPDPAALKSLSKVLLAKARVNWSKNPAESARAIRSVINYSNHSQSEPNNICVLVAMSCRINAYKAALDLAGTGSKVPNAATLLLPVLQQPAPRINWLQLWHVDNATTLESLWLVTSAKGFHDLGLKEGDGLPMRSQRTMLQAKAQIAKLMVDAEAEIAKGGKGADAVRQVAEKYYMPIQEVVGTYHEVFSMLAGGDNFYTNTINTVDSNESHRRLTWLAIKMKSVPSQAKLPPEALQPAWADPFSGKPFVLKRSGAGFILYGVGVDRKDDGGSEQMGPDDWPVDIVVKVP